MAQEQKCSQVDELLSNILNEMTTPVEQILGGPRVEPLQKAVPRPTCPPFNSSLCQWKRTGEYSLPSVPRLKGPVPPLSESNEGTNSIHQRCPRKSRGNRRKGNRATLPSNASHAPESNLVAVRPRRGWGSMQQSPTLPPRYSKARTAFPPLQNSSGHHRSKFPATSEPGPQSNPFNQFKAPRSDAEVGSREAIKTSKIESRLEQSSKVSKLHGRRRVLERRFNSSKGKSASLYAAERYDEYEQEVQLAFHLCFDWGLTMESEFRLTEHLVRSSADDRRHRKGIILKHYDYVAHGFSDYVIDKLKRIGRKQTVSFFRQGVQKVFLRKLALQKLWEEDMKIHTSEAQKIITNVLGSSSNSEAGRTGDLDINVRFSVEKLELIKRIVLEHQLLNVLIEGIISDHGAGHEEAGDECRIQ